MAIGRAGSVVGLFAGVGGLEQGFHRAGFSTNLLCEIDGECRAVLKRHFPSVSIVDDVHSLDSIPTTDVLTAGFPCQSFSQAGRTLGLSQSRPIIQTLLRLIQTAPVLPQYIVLENVPNIIHLDDGEALRYITRVIESLGYTWAYRVVDAASFGLPQRRARWLFVASLGGDAPTVLLEEQCEALPRHSADAFGFYWTEGNTGIGWATDAIPPLKGGSSLGIPSPPAIWIVRTREIVRPTIGDAERLQGFSDGWTIASETMRDRASERRRWRMVGNAVSVPMAEWVAQRIAARLQSSEPPGKAFRKSDKWPHAAWGRSGIRIGVDANRYPRSMAFTPILDFLREVPESLSLRATRGFRTRLQMSRLRYPPAFLEDLKYHERSVAL